MNPERTRRATLSWTEFVVFSSSDRFCVDDPYIVMVTGSGSRCRSGTSLTTAKWANVRWMMMRRWRTNASEESISERCSTTWWRGEGRSYSFFILYKYGFYVNCIDIYIMTLTLFTYLFILATSHHSCGLHRFQQSPCFFVSYNFGNMSTFILTMNPAHLIRIFLFRQLSKPQFQFLLLDLSFSLSPFTYFSRLYWSLGHVHPLYNACQCLYVPR